MGVATKKKTGTEKVLVGTRLMQPGPARPVFFRVLLEMLQLCIYGNMVDCNVSEATTHVCVCVYSTCVSLWKLI